MFAFETILAENVSSETQQIARGLRQRDIAVLHQLVGQYQYRLVRYLIYLTGRRDAVDDLVQETWLRVLERGHSYNGQSPFAPWLFTIARNLAFDAMRKRKGFSLDSSDRKEADHEELSPVSDAPSPFEEAARTEDARHVAQSLESLDPIYREALVLRFQEDLSLQEIAAISGAPVSTVSSRIYRGLAALRKQMEGVDHAH
jgi:RNA polymerase sigma-70 factor (ECF subfamily)